MRDDLALVVLAAGSGTRLGGAAKALLVARGHTYLEHIVRTARAVGCVEAVVVVGPPYGDAVAAHANALGVRVVVNLDPARGMASSVALGFSALAERAAVAAWLWPVDHPLVAAATLRALHAALGAHEVAQPRLGARGGHPPLVARSQWARLAACGDAPDGARGVLATADRIAVAVTDAAVATDVDTRGAAEAIA